MKPRKLKRTLVNGARKEIKKKTKEIIKYNLGPDRDKEIARRKAHEKAAAIYESWIKSMVNKPKTPAELPDEFNRLGAELFTAIGIECSEMYQYIWNDLIIPCIQKSHELALIFDNSTVEVEGSCEPCDERFGATVPLRAWLMKAFDLKCPSCDALVPATKCHVLDKKEINVRKRGRI